MKKIIIGLSLLASCSAFAEPAPTCESAYRAALESPSISDVDVATDLCQKTADEVCDKEVDAASAKSNAYRDVEGAKQTCVLRKAYGANKNLNHGQASSSCEQANGQAMSSILSFGAEAAGICDKESEMVCSSLPIDTGDARLIMAVCQLNSAYGAYLGATDAK